MWFMQFMAHAAVHGYAELLVEEKHDDLPDSNKESETDTEVHKKMRRKHTVAMCHLASAMGNKAENMLFIMKTANKDWPTGQIHLTIKALMKKNSPQDTASHVELSSKLQSLTMESNADPQTLFDEISKIRIAHTSANEADLIAAAIRALPQDYKPVLSNTITQEGPNLTLDHIAAVATTHYKLISQVSTDNEREIAMGNVQNDQNDQPPPLMAHHFNQPNQINWVRNNQNGNGNGNNWTQNQQNNANGNWNPQQINANGNWNQNQQINGNGNWNQNQQNNGNGNWNQNQQNNWNQNGDNNPNQNGNNWNHTNTGWNNSNNQNRGRFQRRTTGNRFQNGRTNNGRNQGNRGNYNGNRPFMACHLCGGPHPVRNCWELPHNAQFRPDNWQSRLNIGGPTNQGNEVANANVNGVNDMFGSEIMMCNVNGDVKPAQDVLGEEIVMCSVGDQLFPTTTALLKDPNIWAADSCSTQHVKTNSDGLQNLVPADRTHNSVNSNGTLTVAEKVGNFPAIQCNKRGEFVQKLNFQNVVVCTNTPFNLLSEGHLHKLGFKVEGDRTYRRFYHPDGRQFVFDIIVHTSKGLLFCTYLKPVNTPEISMANVADKQPKLQDISIKRAHQMFGHMSEDATRKAAAQCGYRITRGSLGVCEPCSISKARRRNLPTGANLPAKATKDNDRAYVDSATLRRKDKNGKQLAVWVWCLIVFETTGFMMSAMLRKKNQVAGYLCQKFHQFKQLGCMPKIIRMDNAGENVKFQQQAESKSWKLGLTYEYTAPRTPQQNSPAETGLHTILTRGNAMCIDANIPDEQMHLVLPKALLTATKLDGLQPVRLEGNVNTKSMHQFGENPPFAKYPLPIFGEAMTISLSVGSNVNSKSKAKGIVVMFVGFPPDHAGDVYEFWDPVKKTSYKSRDWTRLNRMFYPKQSNSQMSVPTVQPEVLTHYIEVPQVNLNEPAVPVQAPVPEPIVPDVPQPVPQNDSLPEPAPVEIPDMQEVVNQVENPISPVHQPMDRNDSMDSQDEDFADSETQPMSNTRRSQRTRKQPKRMFATKDGNFHDAFLNSNIDEVDYHIALTPAEEKFYDAMDKYGPETEASYVDFLTAQEFMAANVDSPMNETETDPDIPPISFIPLLKMFENRCLDVSQAYIHADIDPSIADDQPIVDFTPETFSDSDDRSVDTTSSESIPQLLDRNTVQLDDDSTTSTASSTRDCCVSETSSEGPPPLMPHRVVPPDESTASVGSSNCDESLVSSDSTIWFDVLETADVPQRHQNANLLDSEATFHFQNSEFSCVGAGLGGGFTDTNELHVMTYNQAMKQPDKPEWIKSVDKEHERMSSNNVWTPKYIQDIPQHATILTTKWAMKKKANGTYRARMVARGFEQIDGEHFDQHDTASPVVSEITIRIMFVLMLMASFHAEVVDVCGAFLLGNFEPGHKMYIEVPQGFEKFYPPGIVLLLNKTLYGLRQSAMQFWKLTVRAFKAMNYTRSKADACLQFMWTTAGLVMWITWVDDCLCIGPKEEVLKAKVKLGEFFDTDECGPLNEYIGMKIDWNQTNRSLKLTQPVLIQSYQDEFDLPGESPPNPATQGEILQKSKDGSDTLSPKLHKVYRKGVGKLAHMARWTRPEVLNRVRELSRFLHAPTQQHLNRMYRVMDYIVSSPLRGWKMSPTGLWNGKDKNFLFELRGKSDSDYGVDPETRRSVSGTSVFLQDVCISARSRMQSCVTLSVTEAELVAAVDAAQDMLFAMRVLESMGFKVKKPMILQIDNKGAVDLANNWSSAGRTRHVAVRVCFLRELKEEGVLLCEWIPNEDMSSDIYTKNVGGQAFDRHASAYVCE